jgi:hypothetical protein
MRIAQIGLPTESTSKGRMELEINRRMEVWSDQLVKPGCLFSRKPKAPPKISRLADSKSLE